MITEAILTLVLLQLFIWVTRASGWTLPVQKLINTDTNNN